MKKLLFTFLLMTLLLPTTSALKINIDMPQSFFVGEQLYFNYSIMSEVNQQITFIPRINCPTIPAMFLQEKTISLNANLPYKDVYKEIIVDERFNPQNCTAYIIVSSPFNQGINKNFRIETSPVFTFNLNLCKTEDCSEKSKVFVKAENIYLDYTTNVESPVVEATLIYPDKTKKELELPSSIKPGQIGTYEIELTASKEGYKDINLNEQFGVIKEEANLANISAESKTDYLSYIYIAVAILFILVIIFVLVYYLSRKHLPTPPTNN